MAKPGIPPFQLEHEVLSPDAAVAAFHELTGRMDADPEFRGRVLAASVGNPITIETVPNADRWARKQIANAEAAGDSWLQGIKTPSADPKQAALAAKEKHKQKTQEALNEDRYAKGIAKYDLDDALRTAEAVGASGYANGIRARESKIMKTVADLQPRIAAVKKVIDAMPQATDGDREKRLLAARKLMIEVGKARRG